MATRFTQPTPRSVWELARLQHGVISGTQLSELGYSRSAIRHRVARGRLHPQWPDVFAVGRPTLTREGRWMAAVLTCGPGAAVSHEDAAALLAIRDKAARQIEVTVPFPADPRRDGIVVHRRHGGTLDDVGICDRIPVTSPFSTVVDLAVRIPADELEAMINEGDKRDLFDPEELRIRLEGCRGRPGVGVLKRVIDRRTFTMTDTQLERHFLPLAVRAGFPKPLTQVYVNGYRVDFFWPDLGFLVETDGLRYHRTAPQQTEDRIRDQVHIAAGLVPLRFTRAQVAFDKPHVVSTLIAVRRRLIASDA